MHRPAGGNEVLLPLSQKGVVTGRGFSGRKNVPALLLAMDARRPSVEIDASPMSRRMSCRVDTCPTGTAEERILRFRSRLASCKSTSRATLTSLASDRCSACPYIRRRHQDEIPRNPNHEVRKERFKRRMGEERLTLTHRNMAGAANASGSTIDRIAIAASHFAQHGIRWQDRQVGSLRQELFRNSPPNRCSTFEVR